MALRRCNGKSSGAQFMASSFPDSQDGIRKMCLQCFHDRRISMRRRGAARKGEIMDKIVLVGRGEAMERGFSEHARRVVGELYLYAKAEAPNNGEEAESEEINRAINAVSVIFNGALFAAMGDLSNDEHRAMVTQAAIAFLVARILAPFYCGHDHMAAQLAAFMRPAIEMAATQHAMLVADGEIIGNPQGSC